MKYVRCVWPAVLRGADDPSGPRVLLRCPNQGMDQGVCVCHSQRPARDTGVGWESSQTKGWGETIRGPTQAEHADSLQAFFRFAVDHALSGRVPALQAGDACSFPHSVTGTPIKLSQARRTALISCDRATCVNQCMPKLPLLPCMLTVLRHELMHEMRPSLGLNCDGVKALPHSPFSPSFST